MMVGPLSRARSALVVAGSLGLLAGLLSGSSCAPKQCEDDSYCVRTCECTSSASGASFDCPVQFACAENDLCETAYNEASCDDLCQQFASRDLCGSKRCENENDCVREALCNAFDPNTGMIIETFSCQSVFACDPEVFACEAAYVATSDDQLCQACAAQP